MFCEVADEAALRDVCARLERAGVRFVPFREPDRGHEMTAVATAPVYGRRGRAPLRAFQLLQDPCAAPGRRDRRPASRAHNPEDSP